MDRLSHIKYPVEVELEEFSNLFDASLFNSDSLLRDAISHIRQRNGKMMRPVLVLLMAKLFGDTVSDAAQHSAVALELLHTASLVHDDVVDESLQRRGQLSVNAIYNNKIAVLVGDYLLATCLVEVSKTKNNEIIELVASLGQKLSEGEILQLSNVDNLEYSEAVYFDVIRKKTAALFAACAKSAAISANASPDQSQKAHLFGEYIGICFQIKDDIFDYFECAELGKPTSQDMLEGKLTLPAIYVLNTTTEKWVCDLAVKVKEGTISEQEINRLVCFTRENGGIEYAERMMDKYHQKARNILDDFPDSKVKDSLLAYLDYVVAREK